eukprot:4987792-Pleurochrysis_carterae.AAC.4
MELVFQHATRVRAALASSASMMTLRAVQLRSVGVAATSARRTFSVSTAQAKSSLPDVVLVDGCRIPFQPSGGAYNDLMAYDLSRMVGFALPCYHAA